LRVFTRSSKVLAKVYRRCESPPPEGWTERKLCNRACDAFCRPFLPLIQSMTTVPPSAWLVRAQPSARVIVFLPLTAFIPARQHGHRATMTPSLSHCRPFVSMEYVLGLTRTLIKFWNVRVIDARLNRNRIYLAGI
jgi:hypothetical protein